MRAQLEAIAQALAHEIETTGAIELDGQIYGKNSLNPSPSAGFCRPAVDKFASLFKETNPQSRVTRISITTVGDTIWERSRHVLAEVETPEGIHYVDPTIDQFGKYQRVYSRKETYPIEHYQNSVTRTIIHDGL